MKYLLDVNTLLAYNYRRNSHHEPFHRWALKEGFTSMATCAVVELGFIRISMAAYHVSLADAQKDLAEIKHKLGGFIEKNPSPHLPAWSGQAAKTTDAYLLQLAKSAGLELATFDTGIPGAILIK